MSVKKQTEKQYIAINAGTDDIVAIGSKANVIELIKEYVYDLGWDKNDIEEAISVFELGAEVKFDVKVDVKVSF